MEITQRDYVTEKTKNYLKKGTLFIFCNGTNKNAGEWLITEQALKKMPAKSYKIFNRTTIKTLQNSIYLNSTNAINCVSFLVIPTTIVKEPTKLYFLENIETLVFTVLSIKLNNTLSSKAQLQNLLTLNYLENHILFFQVRSIELKLL